MLEQIVGTLARDLHYSPEAIAAVTLDQLEIFGRKATDDGPAEDGMSERDWHRLQAIYNGWPAWLEEKEWRQRHEP